MSHIECTGQTVQNKITYKLIVDKNTPEDKQKRGGKLSYEKGEIEVDFNLQQIEGHLTQDPNARFVIKTKDSYSEKYSIQLDMVERCHEENITPSIVDGVDLQIEALSWLFSNKEKIIITEPYE